MKLQKFALVQNVEYVLRDKDGKIKQLFQPNKLFMLLIKHGVLSPTAIKIPFVLGRWADSMKFSNLVVSAGRAGVASRLNGSGGEAAFTSIGLGIGTTAPVAGNTTLEDGRKSDGTADGGVHVLPTASVTASRVTTTVTDDTAQLQGTVTFTASLAITESGVFNADTSGTMIARQTFSAINVVNGDGLQVTWKFQVT